jgi:hypothetical protein
MRKALTDLVLGNTVLRQIDYKGDIGELCETGLDARGGSHINNPCQTLNYKYSRAKFS